ncbi:hypothetical protein ACUODJ_04970, partial [Escherichia sp. HC-CC]
HDSFTALGGMVPMWLMQIDMSPALTWLLEYLGDSETLNKEWLREPEETPATGD